MKKLLLLLSLLTLLGCAHQQELAFGKVWCCCNTRNGQCCGWVSICPGPIPGCLCNY